MFTAAVEKISACRWFRVQGFGFRAWGFGFRVLGFRAWFRVLGFRAWGLGFRV